MRKGFTLIELLVVIAIIGILTLIIIGSISDHNPDAEYKICDSNKCYNVESYTKESNCVFMSEEEVRLCGDYSITKLNLE